MQFLTTNGRVTSQEPPQFRCYEISSVCGCFLGRFSYSRRRRLLLLEVVVGWVVFVGCHVLRFLQRGFRVARRKTVVEGQSPAEGEAVLLVRSAWETVDVGEARSAWHTDR